MRVVAPIQAVITPVLIDCTPERCTPDNGILKTDPYLVGISFANSVSSEDDRASAPLEKRPLTTVPSRRRHGRKARKEG
jgi:hypothetical protein